jgi:predicted phosphodiesterase
LRYLILSDIHGNLEALEAVLNAAAGRYGQVLCCGDLVGYGADPNAVADWVRANAAAVVRGNHDRACTGIEDLEWFNPVARAAALWTERQLTPDNADYVRTLPKGPVETAGFHLVHGSPLDEDDYVVAASEAAEAFRYIPGPVTFFGHTHLPGGFVWRKGHVEVIRKPGARAGSLAFQFDPDAAYLLNPGSVGQPRDGDPRAAYAIYDPGERCLTLYRLDYDIHKAQDKIRAAGLPPVLADRLAMGR